jgi:hypothetical protein
MPDIPEPRNNDSEDVVWGLQTADTLWKRGERIDALVWLRRAAQAAGDSNDDARAMELARHAADLTEFMNSELDVGETGEVASVFPVVRESLPEIPTEEETGVEVDAELGDEDLLEVDEEEEEEETHQIAAPHLAPPKRPSVPEASELHGGMYDPWAGQNPAPPQTRGTAPLPPPPAPSDEEVITSVRSNAMLLPPSEPPAPPAPLPPPTRIQRPTQRPSAGSMKAPPPTPSAGPPKPPPPVPRKPALPKPSVPKMAAAAPPPAPEPPPPAPQQEYTAPLKIAGDGSPVADAIAEALERGLAESMGALKAAAAAPLPETAPLSEPEPEGAFEESATQALPTMMEEPEDAHEPPTPPEEETQTAQPEPEPAAQPDHAVVAQAAIPSIPPAHMLDLEPVEAFSDMPDDVRETFAAAASIHELNEGDEIATFALAYVIKGTFEVAATMVDAAAGRLETGQVLRSRGTTEENVPIRMIAAGGPGVIATWSDAAVEEGFRSIPWVEDDLRAAADKMQTLVGITIGPLGERLDMSIREQVISKLKMRPLIPAEIVVNKGETVPGLLLVGIGELELMKGDEVAGVVGSGEFLFPSEVLGMGDAPYTARAGKGGALVMFGDRGVAQELLVTCPPLLEVFAGM